MFVQITSMAFWKCLKEQRNCWKQHTKCKW